MPESQMLTLRLPAAILNTDEILKTVPTEQLIAELTQRPKIEHVKALSGETMCVYITDKSQCDREVDASQIILIGNI